MNTTNVIDQAHGAMWSLYNGDSVDVLAALPTDSIDLSVYSPPFGSLYTYSASERDMGNSAGDAEFWRHYGFLTDHILRVTRPGRVTAVHVADTPAMLARDGYIGLKDFSGDVIRHYISRGWILDARVPIDKNQQAQSIRTHAKGLTMTQMEKDRTWSRPALPDYVLKFRKPGDNAVPVRGGDVTRDVWIEYANPTWPNEHDRCAEGGARATWYGIRESETLNALRERGYAGLTESREQDDERHICPLQLGTIERCVKLWSNAGETVLDPFSGLASTGYVALGGPPPRRKLGDGPAGYSPVSEPRRYIGVELKPAYFKASVHNLRALEAEGRTPDLFSGLDEPLLASDGTPYVTAPLPLEVAG